MANNTILAPCGGIFDRVDKANIMWFVRSSVSQNLLTDETIPNEAKRFKIEGVNLELPYSMEYIFGVFVGLAFFHRVLLNLPLPCHLYKIIKGTKVQLLISVDFVNCNLILVFDALHLSYR